jgi:hypothetical protein
MVTAQVLEVTHTVEDNVGHVGDKVLDVDCYGRQPGPIRLPASTTRSRWSLMVRNHFCSVNKKICLTLVYLEGKETRVAIQQVADDMDQVKR